MSEFNLEARWVNLGEREPGGDNEVFARNINDGMIATIKFFEDGPMRYVFYGEYYMRKDDIRNWEWLEFREKGGE